MFKKFAAIAAVALSLSACTRVDTGEVGLRVNFDKTVEASERPAGSINQTFVGSILTFPVREINAEVANLQPLTAENVTMADVDLTVVYNVNPSAVSDLYTNKSRSFHGVNDNGETLLMQSYVQLVAKNAVYKVVREYEALKINDNRAAIEQKVLATIKQTLDDEKLGNSIIVSQVLVKSAVPPQAITASANALVTAQNQLKQAAIEVQKAEQEAKRIATLNANSGATAYMAAQANLMIAEGIRDGKVNTIVVPADFKGMVNVK